MSRETIGDNLEFKSNFAGKHVTVFTTEKDLRNNVALAALAQDITHERANESLFRTRFSLGIWKDYISGVSELLRLSKLLLNLGEAPIAFVRPRKDGTQDCHINIDQIIRFVQREKSIRSFRVPKGLPPADKEAVLIQAVNKVWEHERQHLIQRMRDKDRSGMDRQLELFSKIRSISLGTFAIASPATVFFMQQPKTTENVLYTLMGVSFLLSVGLLNAGGMFYKSYFCPYDREAYQIMTRESLHPSPFRITFES